MTKTRFRPMVYLSIFNILSFFMLFLYTDAKETNLVYIGLILAFVNITVYAILYYFEIGDTYLFLTSSMLVSIGIIMLYRIGYEPVESFLELDLPENYKGFYLKNAHMHLIWFIIGIIVYLITTLAFGKFHFWDKLFIPYIVMCFLILGVTAIFGTVINGAKNWIFIGPISIQTSEVIKIFFCLALGCFFSKIPTDPKKDNRSRIIGIPKDELFLCIFAYVCMGALMLVQREWGTALLLFLIYFAMTLVYRTNKLLKFINFGGILVVVIFGYIIFTSDIGKSIAGHISGRFEAWMDPWKNPGGNGYQATQGLMAIASGGYFGTGLGLGIPYIVPASHNDFIFTSICEEMGIFTGIAVILLYFILTYRGTKVAIKSENQFLRASCLALVLSLGFQTFLIVGGVINLIPLTGITLPFVSYGGSSMVASYVMLGIITAFSFAEKKRK